MEKMYIITDVVYESTNGKYWCDSYIPHQTPVFKANSKNFHKKVLEVICETDCVKPCYRNGKPKKMYCETKDGDIVNCGYVYKVKAEIEGKTAYFEAWVTIYEANYLGKKEV